MDKEKNINWETDGSIGILTLSNPPENYLIEPEFVSNRKTQIVAHR